MTERLRLHYAPDNASLCVRLALEELGLPYETVLVDRGVKAQKSAAFLSLNPNGLIPVLETADGPLFETGAILTWLSDKQGEMMPRSGTAARGQALQWMFWLANTLHPTLRMLFYPQQYVADDWILFHDGAKQRLADQLSIIESAETAPWRDRSDASAQGCYLAPMLRWAALYGGGPDWFDLSHWPRLMAFAQRTEERPAAQRAALAEGLGTTPFSAPSPCNPPEGQAL